MSWNKNDLIPPKEIQEKVTNETVEFAERFGRYLGEDDADTEKKLNPSQLRRFFGEVKRQQLVGYTGHESDFILLKPKLAYAVGRADKKSKIKDFYYVMSNAIDLVQNEQQFNNFIKVFEAIVAYHKRREAELSEK